MTTDDAKANAEALLATVKKLMTGAEIQACEWTKEDSFERDFYWLQDEEDWPEEPCREDFETEEEFQYDHDQWECDMERAQDDANLFHRHIRLLKSLSIQFSFQISDWINKRNLARARKTTTIP